MKNKARERYVCKERLSRYEVTTPLNTLSVKGDTPCLWRRITQKLMTCVSVFMSVLKAGIKKKKISEPKTCGRAKGLQGLEKHK